MDTENEVREAPVPAANAAPVAPSTQPPAPLSPADERLWAMLAHLSVLLNLVTGFLGVGAALIIYLAYRGRSRYVAYQSLQALIFQLIFWGGGGLLIGLVWAVTGLLIPILVGLFLIPFALIATLVLAAFPVIAVVYGVIGGIQCNGGEDFRYWLIGDWALNLLN
ncbi:MAG: DUF4870 domain-containing protein [Anaerolineae bacterium]|nr:DUF4870 domain-containing protein [Anaerolineae bacterium]